MMRSKEIIALVVKASRLESLSMKRATAGAAKFVLEQNARYRSSTRQVSQNEPIAAMALQEVDAAASFAEYEDEDAKLRDTIKLVRNRLDLGYPVTVVQRDHLPNFDFGRCILVVVIGPDGLVANAAKYVRDAPIIGINPDPLRNDGVLLPFQPEQVREVAQTVIEGRGHTENITLAEVSTNDGQRMLAFNDFFIGSRTHTSARYTITCGGYAEPQSSSGVIVSTGAGSTGWFSSIINMTQRFNLGQKRPRFEMTAPEMEYFQLPRTDRTLAWAVREPFISKHSKATLVSGLLMATESLILESVMPDNGVIFSDGIEKDFIEFTSGTIAEISVSKQSATLVV